MMRFTSASRLACAALVLVSLTCAPVPTRSLPAATTKRPLAVNWLSKDPRGELVLPRTVEIHLTDLDERERLTVSLPSGKSVDVVPAGRGVATAQALKAAASTPSAGPFAASVEFQGPVVLDGRTHEGQLIVERHPTSGLRASVTLPLETYIRGVVAAELPIWSAAPAELEALAIAARTFAVSAIAKRRRDGEPARLTDGVMDQAYRGAYLGLESAGARAVATRLADAVARTQSQVVVRGDRLEETRYHASCGGHTASFADVFGTEAKRYDARGPSGVHCAPCAERAAQEQAARAPDAARPLSWVATLGPDALARAGAQLELGGAIQSLAPTKADAAGRWLEVQVSGPTASKRLDFNTLRSALGYTSLKSGMIDALIPAAGASLAPGASLRVQGRGRGHGVGLCQESARDYAQAGWTSDRILSHYYPGTTVERIKPLP